MYINKNVLIPLLLWILLAAAVSFAQQGAGRGGGQGSGSGQGPQPVSQTQEIRKTEEIEITEKYHSISVGGRLRPKSQIVHQAASAGYIQAIFVEEGQSVKAGQELFSIKRPDDVLDLYKPTVVTSRINGRVSEINIQVESEVNTGEPAVTIIGTDGYVLNANVSDKDAFRIDVGQRVSGRTAGGDLIQGVLTSRSPEPDYSTGLFELTFNFSNSQLTRIGEFVIIDLPIDRTRGVFIDRDLIVRRYGKYFLWIVNEKSELEAREVELGSNFGDFAHIVKGVEAGERYLLQLTGREKEGTRIEVE